MSNQNPIIAHLDLDAFFAAVEELDNPELVGLPLVIGGDPQGRGVVATASYAARQFGIRSAMSAADALYRCPEAVFIRPRMQRYREMSQQVWDLIRSMCSTVEKVGIDEGYLDFGRDSAGDFAAAVELARSIQQAIHAQLGVTASIGIGNSKTVAKIASDRNKPHGITIVEPGTERSFLAPLPVRLLPGVGPRTAEKLSERHVRTIGALASLSAAELAQALPGKNGAGLHLRARGIDPRIVDPIAAPPKSIGSEETFSFDIADRSVLHAEIEKLADHVAGRLQAKHIAAKTITVKLRYRNFDDTSKAASSPVGIQDADDIARVACWLLDTVLDADPGALRLVGVTASRFTDNVQLHLDLDEAF